uniref:Uncharacterized protein n=1 Tax=Manihot esculenta TaxID=3983 RepID=A0A2C9VU90_MANES
MQCTAPSFPLQYDLQLLMTLFQFLHFKSGICFIFTSSI